jgi:hypothetical protein
LIPAPASLPERSRVPQQLFRQCPKCRAASDGADICPACGLVFAKYVQHQLGRAQPPAADADEEAEAGWLSRLRDALWHTPETFNGVEFAGRLGVLVLLAVWSFFLIRCDVRTGEIGGSFMHNIILPFHEAGHVLFMPFGEFMTILGGSLFQVLFPLIVATAFLWQHRNTFGAVVGVWWAGVALLDVAPYIYDSWEPQLVLLGGRTGEDGPHDWIYLLNVLGQRRSGQSLGLLTHHLGALVVGAALVWGGLLLWKAYRER